MTLPRRYQPPAASYRLQLHASFGFGDAARVVPYLAQLGISHVYVSPITTAMPGSTHGYDVRDHSQVNPELGGLPGLYELHEALLAADMGLIVDIVPNHVGVAGDNPWWRDVLRYGQDSRFAGYFDIDWQSQPQLPAGVLVLPILGQSFGAALEAGELQLGLDANELVIRYYDNVVPLAPSTYPQVTGLPPVELREAVQDPASWPAFIEIIDELPRSDASRREQLMVRWRDLLDTEPSILAFVARTAEAINGTPGDPASFDRLEQISRNQHYRLTHWRVAGEELNYRRFFDVNSLAGIRIERDDVFEEVHRLLFQLVGSSMVAGVRVDHVDGLYEPAAYLGRLRARLDQAVADGSGHHIPIYVEKILEGDEELPANWPVDGTTGYEFGARVDQLLIDPVGGAVLDAAYHEFAPTEPRFARAAYQARVQVASESFAGEVNLLALQLHRLAQRQRRWRDVTLGSFRHAVGTTLACFPVYRTYLQPEPGKAAGQPEVDQAISLAQSREPQLSDDAIAFLRQVLLLEGPLEPDEWERRAHFRRRFEQISGPVMAKGLEDTTLFRFNRLLSLNEVGGAPDDMGLSPANLHDWLAARAVRWPNAMLTTSTHDSKRSEDVRARLDLLSEMGSAWRREALVWRRLNARRRRSVRGEPAPTPNDEYYLYQSIVGAWPGDGVSDEFRTRISEHLLKAMREAKRETSWVRPDEAYEAAVLGFVDDILDPRKATSFLRRVQKLVERIGPAATANSLASLTLKMTAPGFPDLYQGSERTFLALTDPDNRRPVDFALSEALLHAVQAGRPASLLDEGTKLWLAARLLKARARWATLFAEGGYERIEVHGPLSEHVFAFRRQRENDEVIVAITRLSYRLATPEGIPSQRWQETSIAAPGAGRRFCDLLDGHRRVTSTGDRIPCSLLFDGLPVAVLVAEPAG